MRWDDLFADLSGQAEALEEDALTEDALALTRDEESAIVLGDRVRALIGCEISLAVEGGERHGGVLLDATRSWLVLREGTQRRLVPVHAITWLEGIQRVAPAPPASEVGLGIGHALREWSRSDGITGVEVTGRRLDGALVRIGADHLELVLQEGERTVAVPFTAIRSVLV
ncbi:hypothetical protein [Serinibacter salmoneus]|nr:hypothetical protein [Serinibacter salmoneus]